MHTPKVVVHVKQRNRGDVVVQLLAERIGQSGEPAHCMYYETRQEGK
jgi:hypothetical protein